MAKKRIQELKDEQEQLLLKKNELQGIIDEMEQKLEQVNKIPLEELQTKEVKGQEKKGAVEELMKTMTKFLISNEFKE